MEFKSPYPISEIDDVTTKSIEFVNRFEDGYLPNSTVIVLAQTIDLARSFGVTWDEIEIVLYLGVRRENAQKIICEIEALSEAKRTEISDTRS